MLNIASERCEVDRFEVRWVPSFGSLTSLWQFGEPSAAFLKQRREVAGDQGIEKPFVRLCFRYSQETLPVAVQTKVCRQA